MAGKGDTRRPGDDAAYRAEWDRIFRPQMLHDPDALVWQHGAGVAFRDEFPPPTLHWWRRTTTGELIPADDPPPERDPTPD